jgi:hypothetical protein
MSTHQLLPPSATGRPDTRRYVITILPGVVLLLAGCALWYAFLGYIFKERALILHARTVPGHIVSAWNPSPISNGTDPGPWHQVEYTYQLPNGRQLWQDTRDSRGFQHWVKGQSVEVEYLPDDPTVSRIKGDKSGSLDDESYTISDWYWRKASLGAVVLAQFLIPGVLVIRARLRKLHPKPHKKRHKKHHTH